MGSTRLHIVGVRHHSPACARLVAHVIRRVRPRFVLVEGPADMNPRIGELLLGHELPIAVFSFHRRLVPDDETSSAVGPPEGALRSFASWSPFAEHSPEWQALVVAREVGAEARFMDLPAWDKAFWGVENRYSDGARRHASAVEQLCKRLHIDGYDALWDHLFEGPLEDTRALDALAERLRAYFIGTRGDEPAGARDEPREALMRETIRAALAKTQDPVVVVCGGYHAPALEVEVAPGEVLDWPTVTVPEGASSWVVPWSFHRLDAFTGYESGLPSPAFYAAVFEHGPREAAMAMLRVAVEHLRLAKQHVSSADLVAAYALAEGLARLRGHDTLRRTDLLDALAAALVKQALDVPLPWSERGRVRGGTDALVVELLRALSGRREGRLHRATPLPPLLADVQSELARHGIDPHEPRARTVKVALAEPADLARSRVLHRLRVLQIPGFVRDRGPTWATDAVLEETWTVARHVGAISALIEAARFGATLADAAGRRLEEALDEADLDLERVAAVLGEAVFIGIDALTGRALASLRAHIGREPELARLGGALERLLGLFGGDVLFGSAGSVELAATIREAYTRGLWLLEHVSGGSSALDGKLVTAVRALRDAAKKEGALGTSAVELGEVMARRAHDDAAPPAVRGACLGARWSLGQLGGQAEAMDAAVVAVRRAASPAAFGDFLAGLFALAREETVHGDDVLRVIGEVLGGLSEHDFLIAIPAMRLAFAWFPPREKSVIAGRVAVLHGKTASEGRALLTLAADPATLAAAAALDRAVEERLRRYGLLAADGGGS